MQILYIQYTNPAYYPPLEHSSRILADAGWRVKFLGARSGGGESFVLAGHPNIDVRLMRLCRTGWRQKAHYAAFCAWVFAVALWWRPKWVYASDLLSCPAGLLLTFIPGLRLIYHEHDSPGVTLVASGLFQRVALWARSRLAARADLCILPNQTRVERFRRTIAGVRRADCVWNCPSRREVPPSRTDAPREDMWIVYHGSLSPARLPDTMLQALCRLPANVRLRVVGYETAGFPTFLRDFASKARELGVLSRLEIIGTVTRPELLDICRKSNVGLALMPSRSCDPNEQTMSGASNKAFEYLACGLAVLVSDLPDWRGLYVEPGYGLPCVPEDAESIASALRWFLDHPLKTRTMGDLGRSRVIAEWNYETQFASVMNLLEGADCDWPTPKHLPSVTREIHQFSSGM